MSNIREPIKKNSKEKKEKIIKMGFDLMCKKGYHNVTTVDIAKYANVSTGIIYQYFKDKHDIFLEGVKDYSNNIMFPMYDILSTDKIDINKLDKFLERIIDSFINTHTMKKEAHEELMAMSHLDSDINNIFKQREIDMTDKITSLLVKNKLKCDNILEKVHIAIGLVDNLCHEVVYHKHDKMDYKYMKKEIINIISNMLNPISN